MDSSFYHSRQAKHFGDEARKALTANDPVLLVRRIQQLIIFIEYTPTWEFKLQDRLVYINEVEKVIQAVEDAIVYGGFHYFKGICHMKKGDFAAANDSFQLAFHHKDVTPHEGLKGLISSSLILEKMFNAVYGKGDASLKKIEKDEEGEVVHLQDAIGYFKELTLFWAPDEMSEEMVRKQVRSYTELCIEKSRFFKKKATATLLLDSLRELEQMIVKYDQVSGLKLAGRIAQLLASEESEILEGNN